MDEINDKHRRNELLRGLREARKQSIEALSNKLKEQKKTIKRIKEQLGEGSKTVPEVASALGLSSSEIMWYVAALKKYGEVAEGEKEGCYFRYELTLSNLLDTADGKDENEPP
jgi:predicted transcriptional regulator